MFLAFMLSGFLATQMFVGKNNAKKYRIILMLLFSFGFEIAHSQESRTEFCIDFRANSTAIDQSYSDNAARIQGLNEFLRNIRKDSTLSITGVSFYGAASPEGSYQLNRKLAKGRLSAIEKFVRQKMDIPEGIVIRNESYTSWDYLKSLVESSDLPYKSQVISILSEESRLVDYGPKTQIDYRIVKLRRLDNGKVWRQIDKLFFGHMRNAYAVFTTYKSDSVIAIIPDTVAEPLEDVVVAEQQGWSRKLHFKTNALGLAMGVANAAIELDLAHHWSFSLPVYYSAWNYFETTIKFRTLATQPELRYWLSGENDGLFAGAHFGLAYYNLAVNGNYRYQDHNCETPAIGGGLSVGYRLPLSKNNRWKVEFSLGAGVYALYYDKFYNTPDVKDGLMVESVKKTYWGVDQATVSFSYMFDLGKKGGKR